MTVSQYFFALLLVEKVTDCIRNSIKNPFQMENEFEFFVCSIICKISVTSDYSPLNPLFRVLVSLCVFDAFEKVGFSGRIFGAVGMQYFTIREKFQNKYLLLNVFFNKVCMLDQPMLKVQNLVVYWITFAILSKSSVFAGIWFKQNVQNWIKNWFLIPHKVLFRLRPSV